MVHLSQIPTDTEVTSPIVEGVKGIQFEPLEDNFTTTVYGSRFAAEDLPKHEMPDREMPKEV